MSGSVDPNQIAYAVKKRLDERGIAAQCRMGEDMWMGEDMYCTGFGGNIHASLVVLFVQVISEQHPAFPYERSLVALMKKTKTPCIIVYGKVKPSYLRDDAELNVVASFVPPPPVGRPSREEDYGVKRCHVLHSDTGVAQVIEKAIQCLDHVKNAAN